MRKKSRHETFITCPDPSIAETLKQGDVIRVTKMLRGEPINVDFIVRYYEQHDSHNGNHLVISFTQELNKLLGKPKSFILEEKLIFNDENMDKYSFCSLSYRRWNMAKVARKNKSSVN